VKQQLKQWVCIDGTARIHTARPQNQGASQRSAAEGGRRFLRTKCSQILSEKKRRMEKTGKIVTEKLNL